MLSASSCSSGASPGEGGSTSVCLWSRVPSYFHMIFVYFCDFHADPRTRSNHNDCQYYFWRIHGSELVVGANLHIDIVNFYKLESNDRPYLLVLYTVA